MSITFPNEMADALRARVQSGEYASESEAIRDGLRVLFARDRAVEERLRTGVGEACDALAADSSRAVNAAHVRNRLAAERSAHKGKYPVVFTPEAQRGSAMTEDEKRTAAEDLAKRLRLLFDVAVAESGSEPTYTQIAEFLKQRGTNLSRSRWTYIVNGHRYVQDAPLFEGLAAYFDVVGLIDLKRSRRIVRRVAHDGCRGPDRARPQWFRPSAAVRAASTGAHDPRARDRR
ncbi:ribbon-helix-helix domain-containing protein [Cryobacterium melibiosiphilum]|uniref:ribbon-helix-helix domain-containing protein n=1 Tax=Cryobacterium melibiosiphilum TaxID=995039 RepID=UPI001F335F03|nr:type II toxin-antitoxin system ParD family antitoxin [Cryobacterium melibiosiphilum]